MNVTRIRRCAEDDCRAIPAAMRAAPTTCWKLRPGSQDQNPTLSRRTREGWGTHGDEITDAIVRDALQKRILLYDKTGEEHYNLISALHKSVRNSDPDAALYWLGRMLEAGEDPLYVARRVVRMAVEDIGLADPNALSLCMAARDAVDFHRHAGGQPGAGTGRGLSVSRSQVQRAVHGVRRSAAGCRTHRGRSGAAAPAQCAYEVDEGAGVRARIPVRARP